MQSEGRLPWQQPGDRWQIQRGDVRNGLWFQAVGVLPERHCLDIGSTVTKSSTNSLNPEKPLNP